MARGPRDDDAGSAQEARIRLDKWLWHARFFRTRTLAVEAVLAGRVRLNGTRTQKPGHTVGPGDTLTLALPGGIRVVRIADSGTRRGSATLARQLYIDLSPDPHDGPSPPLE